jgi:hypothetical protein
MSAFWARYIFTNTTVRDANTYKQDDVNQLVKVSGSPPDWYLILAVSSAGVATFSSVLGGAAPLTYGAVVAETVGGSNVDGVATSVSRSDHVHALPAFGTTAGTFAQGNDSRLSDARTPTAHAASHLPGGSDALTTGAAGTIQPDDAAAVGTAASFARSDHKHAIVAAAGTQGIGGGNTEGSGTSFARNDHDHKVRETGGPTDLTIGSVPDGDAVFRVGTVLQGASVGGNSVSIWMPDAPYASPSTYDDEFTTDSGWTKFDGSTVGTATNDVTNGFARILQKGQSAAKPAGRYKAVANDSPMSAYFSVIFSSGFSGTTTPDTTAIANLEFGCFLGISTGTWVTTNVAIGVKLVLTGRTVADSASSNLVYGIQAIATTWSNISTDAVSTTGTRMLLGAANARVYVRLRRTVGNDAVWIDLSLDGIGWVPCHSFTGAGTIAAIGFYYADSAGGVDTTRGVLVDFVRVDKSTAAVSGMLGRRRNVFVS